MEASSLIRSGSIQFRRSPSAGKLASPRPTAVHVAARDSRELRRARSEADLIGSGPALAPSLPLLLREEKEDHVQDLRRRAFTVPGMVTEEEPEEEMQEERELFGGGMGKGGKFTGGGKRGKRGGDQSENKRIHDRYKEMLRSDPGNPLLLRNYGKFLHEVEGDVKGAEEWYGRAILASPGDGEVLMLYGVLVWENYGEKERGGAYLQRAVEASPHDSAVLAAHARFLWEVGEEDEEEEEENENQTTEFMTMQSKPMISAF